MITLTPIDPAARTLIACQGPSGLTGDDARKLDRSILDRSEETLARAASTLSWLRAENMHEAADAVSNLGQLLGATARQNA